MAEIEKKTKRYPTDLTDERWARIEPPGAGQERAAGPDGFARGFERDPISGPLGRRLADVAEGLSAMADGLLVVSPVRAGLRGTHRLLPGMIDVALGSILLRRIAHQYTFSNGL
jgi:hypothetical protein